MDNNRKKYIFLKDKTKFNRITQGKFWLTGSYIAFVKRAYASFSRSLTFFKIATFSFVLFLLLFPLFHRSNIISNAEHSFFKIKTFFYGILEPLDRAISLPIALYQQQESFDTTPTSINDSSNLSIENERLRAENHTLRVLANFKPDPLFRRISARVTYISSSNCSKIIMLNLGKYDGLEVGNVVVYGDALIGRISEIGDNFSTALLISDSSIKIPIEFIKSQRKFIVNGYDNLNDSLHLTLPFSSFGQDEKNIMLLPGDIAITSAENDLIPAGLIVGHVVQGDSHDAADVNTIKANNNSDNAANGECITSLTTNLSAPDNVKLKVQFNVNMLSLVSVLVKKTA